MMDTAAEKPQRCAETAGGGHSDTTSALGVFRLTPQMMRQLKKRFSEELALDPHEPGSLNQGKSYSPDRISLEPI